MFYSRLDFLYSHKMETFPSLVSRLAVIFSQFLDHQFPHLHTLCAHVGEYMVSLSCIWPGLLLVIFLWDVGPTCCQQDEHCFSWIRCMMKSVPHLIEVRPKVWVQSCSINGQAWDSEDHFYMWVADSMLYNIWNCVQGFYLRCSIGACGPWCLCCSSLRAGTNNLLIVEWKQLCI